MIRATFLSRPALGIALALAAVSGASLIASPAIAAEKQKAPAALKLKLSKDFQVASNAVLAAWTNTKKRPDVVAKQAELKAAESALMAATTRRAQADAQKVYDAKAAELVGLIKPETDALDGAMTKVVGNDDKYQAGAIALDMGLFTSSQALQRKGLDLQLQSGFVPADKVPLFNYYVGKFAYSAKDYMAARTALAAATAGGYHDGEADRYLAETYFAQNDGPGGMKILRDANELARTQGRAASTEGLRRGLKVANDILDVNNVGYFGSELVKAQPNTENWGDVLAALRRAGKYDKYVLLDIARLADRTASYANGSDYMEMVQIGTNLGLPKEVLKAIDAGVAAGKLARSDISVADAISVANARIATDTKQNLLGGYDRDARLPTAKVATVVGAGDSFLSYGQPAKAEEFYKLASAMAGVDLGLVNTRLGIAQYDQGKYADAAASFAKVTGARAPVAQVWAVQAGIKAKGG